MGFVEDITAAVERIRGSTSVTVISHIDADGISSAAIMVQAIERAKIPVVPVFLRQLEPNTVSLIPRDGSLKLFTDMGSGQMNILESAGFTQEEVVILDHHIPQENASGRQYLQVNSQMYGKEYAKCSAAGIAYLVARRMNPENTDLSELAIVGNVGDMMARETGKLTGIARWIAEEGENAGYISIRYGLNCYGLSTRPLHVLLSSADDSPIPGITGKPMETVALLMKLGIYSKETSLRTYEDLSDEEVMKLSSALTEQAIANNASLDHLFAEHYFFPREPADTTLRNASEYATILNACGRWQKPLIGLAVCKGDRGMHYREAEHMLRHHRTMIRELCEYILETGVDELSAIQTINLGDRYPDTVVGTGAGMALSRLNPFKPILVISEVVGEPNTLKISMRTNACSLRRGINLQEVLSCVAGEFGGVGGGHNIAAGAYIPKGCENEFTRRVNELIEKQLESGTSSC